MQRTFCEILFTKIRIFNVSQGSSTRLRFHSFMQNARGLRLSWCRFMQFFFAPKILPTLPYIRSHVKIYMCSGLRNEDDLLCEKSAAKTHIILGKREIEFIMTTPYLCYVRCCVSRRGWDNMWNWNCFKLQLYPFSATVLYSYWKLKSSVEKCYLCRCKFF